MADAQVIPLRPDPDGQDGAPRAPRPVRRRGPHRADPDNRQATAHPGAGDRSGREDEPDREDERAQLDAHVAEAMAFLRRRMLGDYFVDDFGFDAELTERMLLPGLRTMYRHWFRVRTVGLDNVPSDNGALLVFNHSGTLPWDAMMATVALHEEHPDRHFLRLLGADIVFAMPMLGSLARKGGHTLACSADAERLLHHGETVGVFPEGFKGIGKPFSERYKLQRFGRGGFVSAALRTGKPIVPVAIVGAEETYPMLANIKPLARLFGLPYFPVTPTFPLLGPAGAVPLPTKWTIRFCEPISTQAYGDAAAEDPMLVFNLTDQVRETIQQTLYEELAKRGNVFTG